MRKYLFVALLFPLITIAQSTSKTDLTAIYSQAIGDFIEAANEKNQKAFDTLFIGKRENGEPDDFPDIELPGQIQNTQIRLISPELGKQMQDERKQRIYLNLLGWVGNNKAEFVFVVFSNGFEHKYDYAITYKYDNKDRRFELEKLEFKGPPF